MVRGTIPGWRFRSSRIPCQTDPMKPQARKLPPPPDAAKLREHAIAHLARFAATEAGVARILSRRLERWARAAESEGIGSEAIAAATGQGRAAIPSIIADLRALGAVNDAAFAASRAKRLAHSGKSRRATLAHLAVKGVDQSVAADAATENPDRDLAAACSYLRRRRLPPFGPGEPLRAMAALARTGFDRETATRALSLDRDAAETLIIALRR